MINKNEDFSKVFEKNPHLINKSLIGKRTKKWISILGEKNVLLSDFSLVTQLLNEVLTISKWLEISLIKKPEPPLKIDPRRGSKFPCVEKHVHNISRTLRKILPRRLHGYIKLIYYNLAGKFFYKPINSSDEKALKQYVYKKYGTLLNSDRELFLNLLKANRPNLKQTIQR